MDFNLHNIFEMDWLNTLNNYLQNFVHWFLSLELPAQIITGILLILAFIGIGYAIYGILWLVYQIVKGSIIGTIIIIYLSIALVIGIFQIIFLVLGENPESIRHYWATVGYNIKYIVAKAYHAKTMPQKPVKNAPNPSNTKLEVKQGPIVILKEEGSDSNNQNTSAQQNVKDDIQPSITTKLFCPRCGSEFSSKMIDVLKERAFTFCEICGEKFVNREALIHA